MRKNWTVRDMTLVAMFAALPAVLSQVAFPLPSGIPVTLQTFAVALCGFALGAKLGTLSVVLYLLLGAIGMPVFASMQGGIGVMFGVTGGFMVGFLIMAPLCGTKKPHAAALGLLLCHVCGVAQFSLVSHTPLLQSAVVASLPYLIKDGLSVAAAFMAARAVRRGLAAARFSP